MPEVVVQRGSDELVDVQEHERRAGVFWVVCSTLVVVFTTAASSHSQIKQSSGIAFFVAYFAVNLAYAARLAVGPPRGSREQLAAASLVTAALGVQQYLAGTLPMLAILLPLFVLGAVAVLQHAQRLIYLPVVVATALSPLLYVHINGQRLIVQVTLTVVVVMEMAMLSDYGDRLRGQRRQLADAEALASERAVTDELTGLRNRRALVQRIAPTATPEGEVTVIYCDLDGFKPFNDRFGHSAGDALLRRLGQALTDAAGPHGVAYRVGGDEFCVLVNGSTTATAPLVVAVLDALTEDGPGYKIRCSRHRNHAC